MAGEMHPQELALHGRVPAFTSTSTYYAKLQDLTTTLAFRFMFPSARKHQVGPFFRKRICRNTRISAKGRFKLNTYKKVVLALMSTCDSRVPQIL